MEVETVEYATIDEEFIRERKMNVDILDERRCNNDFSLITLTN